MTRLAHFVLRHRRLLIFAWIGLTLFGGFSAKEVSSRWLEQFSIPGYSAYEANQRALKTFGSGEQAPLVAVFHSQGDVTKEKGIAAAVAGGAGVNPGSRTSSFFSTGSDAYVSKDRHTTFAEIYPPGMPNFSSSVHVKEVRARLKAATPAGVQAHLTGRDPLQEASSGSSGGPNVLTEGLIAGTGALIILFFVFGTLPAVLIPIAVAIASILNTFTLIWALTYVTDVSIIVQFLIALVGLGVAIDYALLMIFRFRDELREGEDVETALVIRGELDEPDEEVADDARDLASAGVERVHEPAAGGLENATDRHLRAERLGYAFEPVVRHQSKPRRVRNPWRDR